jgi:outer membrane biosynthesis protein TonB
MTTKHVLSLIFAAVFACTIALGQAAPPNKQEAWPCEGISNLLVDSGGQPVWIDSQELRKHAINAPDPKLPSSLRAGGKITINIIVDTDGHVKCTQALNGHPILRKAVAEAVQNWTFKRFSAGDKPVAVSGHLSFVFK